MPTPWEIWIRQARRALITGIAGQDGGYLAELLLAEGYAVVGLARGATLARAAEMPWLRGVELIEGDLADTASLERAVATARPDEIYNLASHSAPGRAWSDPEGSANVNALGPLRLLEIVREADRGIRLVQASTSEIYGPDAPNPQNESTPLHPASPYGASKAYAHQLVQQYRRRYGVFAANAIFYNHESPRRGDEFVTRRVTRAAARIKLGLERELTLGNLDARRDWGYAADYVRAMSLIARQPEADDFVIGTGRARSVGDFARAACAHVDLDLDRFVRTDPALAGPSSGVGLEADATRARERLGWAPTIGFEELVGLMVDADLEREQARIPSLRARVKASLIRWRPC